jgi:hypothetical protein
MIDCSDNRRSTLPMLENLLYKIISRPTYVVYLPGKRILLVVYEHWITSARICNTLTLKTRLTKPPNTEHGVPNCVGFTVACLPRLHWAICGCELYIFFHLQLVWKGKRFIEQKDFVQYIQGNWTKRINGKFPWNDRQTNLDTIIKRKLYRILVTHVRTQTE